MLNDTRLLDRRGEAEPASNVHMPTVLLINEDPGCAATCCNLLDELGYRYTKAFRTREALEKIGGDATIEIVLIDVDIPSFDSFRLIEEARARLIGGRALAPVLLTGKATAEIAIKGMHIEAVDLVCRPLELDACSAAMRRAMRYLAARRHTTDGLQMNHFTQRLGELVAVLEGKGSGQHGAGTLTTKQKSATLQNLIATRGLRGRYFPAEMFADPAWDILLDLTRAKLEGQQVSVSSVCIAASVPMSTALRWVRQMTDAGLLRRWTDPKDRRRDLIALTEATAAHMEEYLGMVHAMPQKA